MPSRASYEARQKCMLEVQKLYDQGSKYHIDFLEEHGKRLKRLKKKMQDINMDLHSPPIPVQCNMTRGKCGGSHFTHYTTFAAPNYKAIFSAEHRNCKNQYMSEPMQLYAIRTVASI